MSDAAAPSDPDRREEDRCLCSHLVRLVFENERYPSETVLLEDIGADGAGVAVESEYPSGLRLKLTAEGFEAPAMVVGCRPRETDYRLSIRFTEGVRWSRVLWEPDHLFLPPPRTKKTRGASPR